MNVDSVLSRHFGVTPEHKISIVALFVVIVVGFFMFVYGAATGATTDALFIVGLVMLLLGIIGEVVLLVYVKRKGGNSLKQPIKDELPLVNVQNGGGNTLEQTIVPIGNDVMRPSGNDVMRPSGNTVDPPIEEELPLDKTLNYISSHYLRMFTIVDNSNNLRLLQQKWNLIQANPHIPGAFVFMNQEYRVNIVKCNDDDCDKRKRTVSVGDLAHNHGVGLSEVVGPQIIHYDGGTFEILITDPYDVMLIDMLESNVEDDVIDAMKERLPEILDRGNVHLHNIVSVNEKNDKGNYVESKLYLVDIDPYEEQLTKQANASRLINEIRKVNNLQPWVNSRLMQILEGIRVS